MNPHPNVQRFNIFIYSISTPRTAHIHLFVSTSLLLVIVKMSRTSTHVLEPANSATQASGSCSTSLFVSNVHEHSPPKRAAVEQLASPPGSIPRRSPTKRMLHLVRRIDFKRIISSFSRPSDPLQTEGSQVSPPSAHGFVQGPPRISWPSPIIPLIPA